MKYHQDMRRKEIPSERAAEQFAYRLQKGDEIELVAKERMLPLIKEWADQSARRDLAAYWVGRASEEARRFQRRTNIRKVI
jgi:hypothetical protein